MDHQILRPLMTMVNGIKIGVRALISCREEPIALLQKTRKMIESGLLEALLLLQGRLTMGIWMVVL